MNVVEWCIMGPSPRALSLFRAAGGCSRRAALIVRGNDGEMEGKGEIKEGHKGGIWRK